MANNLFISYDLRNDKDYPRLTSAITALGSAVKVHLSLYYLKTNYSAQQVGESLLRAIDTDDRLVVIDANTANWWNPIGDSASFIQMSWNQ